MWGADGGGEGAKRYGWGGAATAAHARTGPMIVDCQWKRSSPSGPALQVDGGSFARSWSSFLMRLVAAPLAMADQLRSQHHGAQCGRGQR